MTSTQTQEERDAATTELVEYANAKFQQRIQGYAAKFIAEHGRVTEPTPELMAQTFAHCVRPAKPAEYALIAEEITTMQRPPFRHLLKAVRQYHKAHVNAWNAPDERKAWAWDHVREMGAEIRREYGIPTYCRIGEIALRYC